MLISRISFPSTFFFLLFFPDLLFLWLSLFQMFECHLSLLFHFQGEKSSIQPLYPLMDVTLLDYVHSTDSQCKITRIVWFSVLPKVLFSWGFNFHIIFHIFEFRFLIFLTLLLSCWTDCIYVGLHVWTQRCCQIAPGQTEGLMWMQLFIYVFFRNWTLRYFPIAAKFKSQLE